MSDAQTLIWDDPFSSIDVIWEKDIIQGLKLSPILKNRTIILTSHRLSTVRQCDQVFYIDPTAGLVESGGPIKVLESGTKTYEFFEKQFI